MSENETKEKSLNFIEQIIEKDLKEGKHKEIHTRFPPEPNGYLHIGHAKAICADFGLGRKYNGKVNLRFDDTNPEKEDQTYVDAIKEDIKWLGFDWDNELHASDHFQKLYDYAVQLIKDGKAYVCEQTAEEIASYKGTPTVPGKPSPFRDRSVEENLELFEKMAKGEVEEGSLSLRAKIDMAHANMHMRDPLMYRVRKKEHHRTGSQWSIYPMYDFAHGVCDAIEGITHSICTLEFEVHRPLYEWFNKALNTPAQPQQIEMARLNVDYTITSKRKLLQLVEGGHVNGWDDPRMPTIMGIRRRGFTPESIRTFCDKVGISKRESITEYSLLEACARDHLNKVANRVMAVMDPLKVVITNYPEGEEEWCEAINNPEDESAGKRNIPFSKELFIERSDFMEDAPKKFFRLTQGKEVRFKYAYYITCNEVVKDDSGEIVELHCTYDPATKGGWSDDGRKVKGTIHWVSAKHAVKAEVNLYDRLFQEPAPGKMENFLEALNPDSFQKQEVLVEPSVAQLAPETKVQFERTGYFCVDKDSSEEKPVLNRTVMLRDNWAKR
jgi:glutaminyl-tRNA synthetase